MHIFSFKEKTIINSEAILQELFKTKRLTLAKYSTITCIGDISFGEDTTFTGHSYFSDGVSLEKGCIISDTIIESNTNVRPYSILTKIQVGKNNLLGPFCFVRDDCNIQNDCIIGAHVEVARSKISSGVKISHRAYVGDAIIGQNTIIGANVVFCNFDGKSRQTCIVGSNVILGSGSLIISPLSIGNNTIIGAGSILTKDVSDNVKIIQKRL